MSSPERLPSVSSGSTFENSSQSVHSSLSPASLREKDISSPDRQLEEEGHQQQPAQRAVVDAGGSDGDEPSDHLEALERDLVCESERRAGAANAAAQAEAEDEEACSAHALIAPVRTHRMSLPCAPFTTDTR